LPQSKNPEDARTEADFISPSPDLAGHKDAVLTYATAILDEHGLTTSAVTGNNQAFTSALDRIIANADVQDAIEENQEMFAEVERKAYAIISAQLKSVGSNIQLPANDLVIVYPKPKVLVSDSEILENMKKMKELGIFHDWELLQVFDPNLDENQAKEKLDEISQNKVDLVNSFEQESDGEETEETNDSDMSSDSDSEADAKKNQTGEVKQDIQKEALNGAQVASLVGVVEKVSLGIIPRDSAIRIVELAFQVDASEAERLIASAGKGFKPTIASVSKDGNV
jgi:hypothetical protein